VREQGVPLEDHVDRPAIRRHRRHVSPLQEDPAGVRRLDPPIIRSVVVFPQPLGPRIEKNSPSAISNVTSFTAVCVPNRLLTPVIAIATRPFSGRRV